MSADEQHKAVEALLMCVAGAEVGDLVDEIGDAELIGAYAMFLTRLSALKAGAK